MRMLNLIVVILSVMGMNAEVRAREATVKDSTPKFVYVRVVGKDGKLTDPVMVPMVVRTEAEWKKKLTPEQFRIMRTKGTEPAFCGGLLKNKEEGVYLCIGCDLPLFESNAKFESGTGWPSFFQPVGWTNISEVADLSYGMVRTEINCARCDGHLGHIFEDGPRPTGLRYCLNSESLRFLPTEKLAEAGEEIPAGKVEQAVFSGGRFWGLEAVFDRVAGVLDATTGYATGDKETAATADSAGSEGAGSAFAPKTPSGAEAVLVVYDPSQVSYEKLLEIHKTALAAMPVKNEKLKTDPKYRQAVFYSDEKQRAAAEASGAAGVEPLKDFQTAPLRQQNFAERNPADMYVEEVIAPMLMKLGVGQN